MTLYLYMHCTAQQLNLAVVSACKIQECHNTESVIGEVARFFQLFSQEAADARSNYELVVPSTKVKKPKDACRTQQVLMKINCDVCEALHSLS